MAKKCKGEKRAKGKKANGSKKKKVIVTAASLASAYLVAKKLGLIDD